MIQILACSEEYWVKYRPVVFIQSSITVLYYYYNHILLGTVFPLQELVDDIRYVTQNTDIPLGGPVTRVIRNIPLSG